MILRGNKWKILGCLDRCQNKDIPNLFCFQYVVNTCRRKLRIYLGCFWDALCRKKTTSQACVTSCFLSGSPATMVVFQRQGNSQPGPTHPWLPSVLQRGSTKWPWKEARIFEAWWPWKHLAISFCCVSWMKDHIISYIWTNSTVTLQPEVTCFSVTYHY